MDLFDPKTYAPLRRPLLEAETLPGECYTSPEFYQREMTNIFLKSWIPIGREDLVPKVGDYFVETLFGSSFIVIRGRDRKLRAFVNACRHRGTQMLYGKGNCMSIACPYHGWAYNLDGSILVTTFMEKTQNLNPKEYGLVDLKLDTWMGFVFVNFDPNAEPLKDFLAGLDHYTESYHFEDMKTVGTRDWTFKTNWKIYAESSSEGIHLPMVHKKTIGHVMARDKARFEIVDGRPGNFHVLRTYTERSRAVLEGDQGFDRIPTLSGPAADGAQYIYISPFTTLGADLDCMWYKTVVPEGIDKVRHITGFCFPKFSLERPDADVILKNYMKRFPMVIEEDGIITEKQWDGLSNPHAKPGRFAAGELGVWLFDNWVVDRVLGKSPVTQIKKAAA
jgi:choline monooxygenase